ncbi:MAG: hypothetical protein K2N48_13175, partial [Muribaculaceae bacterium]|nr:hypothetical protein [Muribaculaceae bacterium]
MENTVQRRWSSELLQSTRGLTEECSRFKNVLFRGVMGNGQYGDRDTDRLLTAFNRYLKSWEDYGEQIVNGLNEASDDHKDISSNVDYNDIREFVYASYDYASVLQYADGVFKGIGDDKFKKADDVRDFFDHTIGKAFDDRPDTVGGVLDVFLQCEGPEWNIIDTMGTSNFKTLRSNRRKLFNPSTRTELYRAIDKTLKYLTNHVEDLKTNSSYDGTRTLISAINTIVDYAQISVTIYASRIYVIGTYAHPYMMYKGKREDRNTGTTAPMTEAAMNYYDDARYHVFRDADDGALRDPNNCEQLCKLFEKFLKEIGVPDLGNSRRRCTCSFSAPYIGDNALQQNVFCQKMLDDPIFNNVSSCRARYWRSGIGYNEASVNELNMVLKGSVYNRMQGLGDTSSDKNNILHIIRGTEPKTENVKGYMDLAEDLNTTALVLLIGIREVLNEFAGIASGELNNPTGLGLPQVNAAAEVMRMLSFLYREIAFAVIQKARYIEIKLNEMVDEDATRIASELSIKIPGKTDDSVKLNDAMMMSVPDTSRMPMELIDLYMLPTFEALEMYDDALRMDPMFESDIYLSEAVNISSIINAIIALIQGSLRRFQSFWNNDGVKSAVKWVTDHEQEILKIDTTGKSMKVLPFKVNASGAESIDITTVSDNLISKLNQFPANG